MLRRQLGVFVLGGTLLGVSPISAHDIENTHLLIAFMPDGQYQIDVLNDADWMWLRLAGSEQPLPTIEERDRQLAVFASEFGTHVSIVFDGEPSAAGAVEYIPPVSDDTAGTGGWIDPGLMRLTGTVPTGAQTFQIAYGLIEDPYPLTIAPPTGEPITRWLMALELSETFAIALPRPMSRAQVSGQYLTLGFTHILPRGLDHILFVLGLFLLSPRLKPLLMQVTAFTVAHTITLGLTIYGVFSMPSTIVEPLIALSIAYVAVENLVTTELKPWRVVLVFAFGLLHGMGFAGVLAELGLPRSEFLTAVVTFNMGVEAGQLTVISLAFAGVVGVVQKEWYRRRVAMPLSILIAAVGLFWTVERLM
jgi:hypothetical protein